MMLLVDNYDSFTYNLAHLFAELGAEVEVRRNDAIDADEAERLRPSHLVVSPGPGRPEDSGATLEIVRRLAPHVPTLGVCLGHQAIVQAFGRPVIASALDDATDRAIAAGVRRVPAIWTGDRVFHGDAGVDEAAAHLAARAGAEAD